MPIKNRISEVKIKVIECLASHKKKMLYRDNDEALIARVWMDTLVDKGIDVKSISAYELLAIFSKNELPSAETIVRARRLAQNDCEELRGETWRIRHTEEEEVRQATGKGEI